MIDEVEADGDEIAGPRDAGAEARAGRRGWKRRRIEPPKPVEAAAREGGTVHVGDHPREVADPPLAVDEARLLLSFGAEADEFHACSSWARPLGAAVFWTALRPQTSLGSTLPPGEWPACCGSATLSRNRHNAGRPNPSRAVPNTFGCFEMLVAGCFEARASRNWPGIHDVAARSGAECFAVALPAARDCGEKALLAGCAHVAAPAARTKTFKGLKRVFTMKRFHRSLAAATVSLAALMALGGGAQASSFYIRTGQSAEGLGMPFAGGASGGIGIGSIGWNPATITMFPGRNSNWNATYILPQAEYDLQLHERAPDAAGRAAVRHPARDRRDRRQRSLRPGLLQRVSDQ